MACLDSSANMLVCDSCLTAACWYGEFMCEDARGAGLKILTVRSLRKLKRENEDQWSDEKLIRVYGNADRDFSV